MKKSVSLSYRERMNSQMTTKEATKFLEALIKQTSKYAVAEQDEKAEKMLLELVELYEMALEAIKMHTDDDFSHKKLVHSFVNDEIIDLDRKCGTCMHASEPVKFSQKGKPSYVECSLSTAHIPFFQRTRRACKLYKRRYAND